MKRLMIGLLCLALLCPCTVLAQQPNEVIDSITLTIAPSYGPADELTNAVITLPSFYGGLLWQIVHQKSGAVLAERILLPNMADLEAVSALIQANRFLDMPEHLETGVLDGDFNWITVRLGDGSEKRVGGLLAGDYGPEAFTAIYRAIGKAIENSAEFPPWLLPQYPPMRDETSGTPLLQFCGGEALTACMAAELPSLATVCYSTVAGGQTYATLDAGSIQRTVEAMSAIRVFPSDAGGHTDDYLDYTLQWADGTVFYVTFQRGKLMGGMMELYPLSGYEALLCALPPILED